MFASLWRLRHVIGRYRGRLGIGILAFGAARGFEIMVPIGTAEVINRLADGNYAVGWIVLGMVGAVLARYVVVTFARYSVRSAGLGVAFDLRQRLYADLQHQGAEFFGQHTIGDMMTRAVADIALVQRLISMGTILLVILIYASLFGFAAMLYYSPLLTQLLLPPMPLVLSGL